MTDTERAERLHDLLYSCESRDEMCERLVMLEDESAKLAIMLNVEHIARLNIERENARLVSVLHEVEEDAVLAYHCLQSDIEHVMKSETEFFEKWWHSECRNDNKLKRIEALESENAKLREERDMYRDLVGMMDHPDINAQLNAENAKLRELIREAIYAKDDADWASIVSAAIELGVEVK